MLIKVHIPGSPYCVRVGESVGELGSRLREYSDAARVFVISDKVVAGLYRDMIASGLKKVGLEFDIYEINAGEEYKSLCTLSEIYSKMSALQIERFTPVIGFGGGVVGDLAGFAASTYLRGLPFFNVPTTLLAQVDSSVGGKTGINLPEGKNLAGTFYQPSYVHADVELLSTLPGREFSSGLAEVVKHAVIQGEDFLSYLEGNAADIMRRDPGVMEIVVSECVKIKAGVVERDEKEMGLRRILNLGHTLAHALETSAGYGVLTHGEAVSIGLAAAALLAEKRGASPLCGRLGILLETFGLPRRVGSEFKTEELIKIMKMDKKVRAGKIEFVIPVNPGNVQPGVPVEEKAIAEVIEELREN